MFFKSFSILLNLSKTFPIPFKSGILTADSGILNPFIFVFSFGFILGKINIPEEGKDDNKMLPVQVYNRRIILLTFYSTNSIL